MNKTTFFASAKILGWEVTKELIARMFRGNTFRHMMHEMGFTKDQGDEIFGLSRELYESGRHGTDCGLIWGDAVLQYLDSHPGLKEYLEGDESKG